MLTTGRSCHLWATMDHIRTSDIKVRVKTAVRDQLAEEAKARDLAVSDIVREALREYLRPRTVVVEVDARQEVAR